MFINFYVPCKRVDMCIEVSSCVSMPRDQKMEAGVAVFHYFLFTLLSQGLTLDLGLMFPLLS